MGKINKRDRDVGIASAYRDLENPGRMKAKKTTNRVFVCSMLLVGSVLIIYVKLFTDNMSLKQETNRYNTYMQDPDNIKVFEWHTLLEQRSNELILYRDGAEQFLNELAINHRYSEEHYRFFETLLKESTSADARILTVATSFNTITIDVLVSDWGMPKLYAEALTNLKNDKSMPMFSNVIYSGFEKRGTEYVSQITIELWQPPKIDPA